MGDIINNDNLYFSSGDPFYRTSGALCSSLVHSWLLIFCWSLLALLVATWQLNRMCRCVCTSTQAQGRRKCSLRCWAREAWEKAR